MNHSLLHEPTDLLSLRRNQDVVWLQLCHRGMTISDDNPFAPSSLLHKLFCSTFPSTISACKYSPLSYATHRKNRGMQRSLQLGPLHQCSTSLSVLRSPLLYRSVHREKDRRSARLERSHMTQILDTSSFSAKTYPFEGRLLVERVGIW